MPVIDNNDTNSSFNQGSQSVSNATKKIAKTGKKALEKKMGQSIEQIIISSIKTLFAGLGSSLLTFFLIVFLVITVSVFITMFITGNFEFGNNDILPAYVDTPLKEEIYNAFWDVADTNIYLNYEAKNPKIKYRGTKVRDLIEPYLTQENLLPYDGASNWIIKIFNSPKKDSEGGLGYTFDGNDAWNTFHAEINFEPELIDMVLNGAAYCTAIDNTVMYFSTPEEFNTQYTPDKSIQATDDWELQKGTDVDSRLMKPYSEQTSKDSEDYSYTDDDGIEHTGTMVKTNISQSSVDAIKDETSNVNKDANEEYSDFYYFLRNEEPDGDPIYEYQQVTVNHWYGEEDNFMSKIVETYGIKGTFDYAYDYHNNPEVLVTSGLLTQEELDTIDNLSSAQRDETIDKLIYPTDDYRYYMNNKNYIMTTVAGDTQVNWMQIKADGINPDYTTEETQKVQVGTLEIDERRWKRTRPVFEISSDTSEWTHDDLKHSTRKETKVEHYKEYYNKATGDTANITCNITYGSTTERCYENGKQVNLSDYGVRDSDETYSYTVTYNDYSTKIEIPYNFDFTEYKEKLLEDKAQEMVGKGQCIPNSVYGEYSKTCTLEEATEYVDMVKTQYLDQAMAALGIDNEYYGQFYGLKDNGYSGIIDYALSSFDYYKYSGEWSNGGFGSTWYKYFTHANTLQAEGKIHGSGQAWGKGSCTYVAQAWFYDVYEMNSSTGASGSGKQFADEVLKAHSDMFVRSSTPAPGAVMSIYNSGNGHVICIDGYDEATNKITVTEGDYDGKGSIRIRYTMDYDKFMQQGYIKGYSYYFAVPVK